MNKFDKTKDFVEKMAKILKTNIFLYKQQVKENCLHKFIISDDIDDPIRILLKGRGNYGDFKLIKFPV